MTVSEIISEIREIGFEEFCYDDFNRKEFKEKVGKYKNVAERGGEDEGSEWWHVFYFEDHDIFIKIEGYYSSYHGVDNLRAFEVEPKEVTITVYQTKK